MLRSILLALDDTPASVAAKRLALSLAAKAGASVTGLAVIDPQVIAPPEATPMGAGAYKEHKDAVLIARAESAAGKLVDVFTANGDEAKVRTLASVVTGEVLEAMIAASDLHDLIVGGIDTSFDENASGRVSSFIARLLHGNPRPVVVCPQEPHVGSRVLVAYDGSVPAMRAIQLFCCLGLWKTSETLVVSIGENMEATAALSARGAKFMSDHGYQASTISLPLTDNPAAALIKVARDNGAGLIVAGAYGHRGWREWLLGSTTMRLIEASSLPLFLHH